MTTVEGFKPASGLPPGPESLTPAWLADALRDGAGIDAKVASLAWENISDGLGFTGQVVRLKPVYDAAPPGAPQSLVAKFAAPLESARRLMNELGGYQREVRFYGALARDAGLPAPRCFFGGYDAEAGHFVLLLEDLSDAKCGDQVAGASLSEAEFVVAELARFHAKHWNDAALLDQKWLWPSEALVSRLPELYDQGMAPLRENLRDEYAGLLKLIEKVRPLAPSLAETFGDRFPPKPFTLVHGDVRLDNMFFPSDGNGRFAVVDWQGAAIGSPGNELAYWLVLSLPVEVRRAHEAALLQRYQSELAASGVKDYPLSALERDYRQGILIQLVGLPIVVSNLDFSSGRGQELATAALDRMSAAATDFKASRIISVLTWYLRLAAWLRKLFRR
jgi:aminoglycoside/choline kinase family phosphotransferase